jgi:hypothetical protein
VPSVPAIERRPQYQFRFRVRTTTRPTPEQVTPASAKPSLADSVDTFPRPEIFPDPRRDHCEIWTSRKFLDSTKVTGKKFPGFLTQSRRNFFRPERVLAENIFRIDPASSQTSRPSLRPGSQGRLRRSLLPVRPSRVMGVPERILVQRSPERCQLYLFYPGSPGWEIIIRKNAEQSPEIAEVCRRE